jgi:hypothetical protein
MQIIDMMPDYQEMVRQINEIGSFEAYKRYTQKYPQLFGAILQYLYMTDLDKLRPLIENVDFGTLLKTAKSNRSIGLMTQITTIAEHAATDLGADGDFTLYLGLEMGNIGGFSGDPNRQILYIGTEKPLTKELISYLVPHEVNHMVRTNALPDIDMFSFSERVISEGLGTYYALKYNQLPFTAQGIAKVLFISPTQANNLLNNSDSLLQEMTPYFGKPMTQELMQQYFTYSTANQEIALPGYFIGMVICQHLVNAGNSIDSVTKTPSERIMQTYFEL